MTFTTLPMALVIALAQYTPLPHEMTLSSGLESPTRLTVTTSQIMVTDLIQYAVVRFDLTGTPLGSWSEPAGPIGIAAHPDGRIFVSRKEDAQVAVYDAAFTFLRFLGAGVVTFTAPTDIALDPLTGRICVTDSGADRFVVFDDSEALVMIVGMRGAGASQFRYPAASAIDVTSGRIAVADQDNYRVQLFSDTGLHEKSFGYRIKYVAGGGSEGWMPRTSGVAFDSSGNVYVLDALMGTLRVFSPTGAELAHVAQYGVAPGELRSPTDVVVDVTGKVYVANAVAGTVEVYSPFVPTIAAATTTPASGSNDSGHDALFRRGLPAIERKQLSARTTRRDAGGTVATTTGWDPPHMLADTTCGRCHDVDGQPEGHIGLVAGQTNVCVSCHIGGGHGALMLPSTNVGMSHKWGVDAINETFGSTGPLPNGPMADHLDGGLIKCATCHNQHSSDDGVPFLRGAGDAICSECHSEHIGHTPQGAWQPGCRECHQAHDPTAQNLSLVSGSVFNLTLGVDKTVVLTSRTGPNGFAGGSPTNVDGICQVCHTTTTYHTHDGTGAPHQQGADCISCHPHENGFMPSGGGSCTGCHGAAQDNGDGVPIGGRRAIVGEFPLSDAHAHYGAELDDAACLVCHSVGTHMDGFVELVDQDAGSLYRFLKWQDLPASPDVSDFCASCHDADGASLSAAPFDPFGNGSPASDVEVKFAGTLQWEEQYNDGCFGSEGVLLRPVNSHHDISDSDQAFSGAKVECLNCHGAHTAGGTQPLADPFNATTAWIGTNNEFCLACHNGGTGPLDPGFPIDVFGPVIDTTDPRWASLGMDWSIALGGACETSDCSAIRGIDSCDYTEGPWYIDFSWTHGAHGLDSKRGWNGYSGADAYDMDCMGCHDPHGSYTPTNTEGNPYLIRDFVDGTGYVDDGSRELSFNGPPWDTFGVARQVVIPIAPGVSGSPQPLWAEPVVGNGTNGLCNVCHADWVAASANSHFDGFCDACQNCHRHGALWGEHDWEGGDDSTPCPIPAPAPAIEGGTAGFDASDAELRLHLWPDGRSERLDTCPTPEGQPEEAVKRPVTKQK